MVKPGPKPKTTVPKKKRNYAVERRNAEARKAEDHTATAQRQWLEQWRQQYTQAINERLYSLPYEDRPEYDPPEKLPIGFTFEHEVEIKEKYRDAKGKLREREVKVTRRITVKPPEPNHYDWHRGHKGTPPPFFDYLAILEALTPETRELLSTSPAYLRLVNEAGWYPRKIPGHLDAEEQD